MNTQRRYHRCIGVQASKQMMTMAGLVVGVVSLTLSFLSARGSPVQRSLTPHELNSQQFVANSDSFADFGRERRSIHYVDTDISNSYPADDSSLEDNSGLDEKWNVDSTNAFSSDKRTGKRAFHPWGGKRSHDTSDKRMQFEPWGGKRSLEIAEKKNAQPRDMRIQNTKSYGKFDDASDEQEEKREFQPWGGKREFQPWGGKRSDPAEEEMLNDKREFQPWGGKRAFQPWGGKRYFQPWGGKRPFHPWGRKRGFQPWGGKREFQPWGGKRSPDLETAKRYFQPWGGKRAFQPWGGKRAFQPWGGKREFQPWGGKRAFQPWRGKREFQTSGSKRPEKRAFHPWGGKRAFEPWGGKRAFHPWGGKRSGPHEYFTDSKEHVLFPEMDNDKINKFHHILEQARQDGNINTHTKALVIPPITLDSSVTQTRFTRSPRQIVVQSAESTNT